MKESKMSRIRDVAINIKEAHLQMQITDKELKNLAEKHHVQRKRFLDCCTKMKELLKDEDSV